MSLTPTQMDLLAALPENSGITLDKLAAETGRSRAATLKTAQSLAGDRGRVVITEEVPQWNNRRDRLHTAHQSATPEVTVWAVETRTALMLAGQLVA
ncbi:hypothetical protein [Nocardia sp. NPDC051750]|uniref:hypothetical protein n=1 Tax=Nocardia sp. NPDC051750 TaxID=3364325 RepID=UPI00379E85DC